MISGSNEQLQQELEYTLLKPDYQNGSVAFTPEECTNSILFTDYLTKMGIKIFPYPPTSPDLTSCDF